MMFYKLEGHKAVPCDEVTWARSMKGNRRVAHDEVGAVRISTVFLGLDHSFAGGPPMLFETMIFGGAHDQYQRRCSTWEQAETIHADALAMVNKEK